MPAFVGVSLNAALVPGDRDADSVSSTEPDAV